MNPPQGTAPQPRRQRTVVLSDVHLSQAHPEDPSDPLWMRYRRAEHHPDEDFAALVDTLLARHGEDAIELVWNGDVFDFDAPWVKNGESSADEFPLNDEGCSEQMARILADHPVWIAAAARLLAAGHRLLVLSGNHDIELYWPGVRRVLREALGRAWRLEAERRSLPLPDAGALEARVRFRSWFHVTEDGVYLEHGSQYDMFNGVRHAMLPLTRERDRLHPLFGKLAFKRTGSLMGYFNPYYEETFYMGLTGYFRHFVERYAFSRRHIARTWLKGSLRTVAEIWRHRHDEDWHPEQRELAREETGATSEAIDATFSLGLRPADATMLPILRELWLDRAALGAVVLGSIGLSGVFGKRAALATSGTALLLFTIYELATPKPDVRTYDSAPPEVRRLLDIHDARAVCMGHTHRPFGDWESGRFYGNSGSWCPAFHDPLCTKPVLDRRPVLMLWSDERRLWGGLYHFTGDELVADPRSAEEPPAGEHSRERSQGPRP